MMKSSLLAGSAFTFMLVSGLAHAQDDQAGIPVDTGPEHHLVFQPGEIEWRPAPASLERGAEIAILEGDPSESGVFTMRIRMPDGFRIAPHWHPNVERVTVISGTFHLGPGDSLDKGAAQPLGPGSYTSMPPGMRHYAFAEGETVVQISTVGPWQINYVNPADDPRLRRRQ